MSDAGKVVINLATGLDDAERVTVALLVANAALEQGREVAAFVTKEAVRLATVGYGEAIACDGCPPVARLLEQFGSTGGTFLVCPICFNARKLAESELVGHARLAGATPLWQWIGAGATVFSY